MNTWIPAEWKPGGHAIHGSHDLQVFIAKVERRSLDFGILVAWHGITGDTTSLTMHMTMPPTTLIKGIQIIVITYAQTIERLTSTLKTLSP